MKNESPLIQVDLEVQTHSDTGCCIDLYVFFLFFEVSLGGNNSYVKWQTGVNVSLSPVFFLKLLLLVLSFSKHLFCFRELRVKIVLKTVLFEP